jgi:hypothetical protein
VKVVGGSNFCNFIKNLVNLLWILHAFCTVPGAPQRELFGFSGPNPLPVGGPLSELNPIY